MLHYIWIALGVLTALAFTAYAIFSANSFWHKKTIAATTRGRIQATLSITDSEDIQKNVRKEIQSILSLMTDVRLSKTDLGLNGYQWGRLLDLAAGAEDTETDLDDVLD